MGPATLPLRKFDVPKRPRLQDPNLESSESEDEKGDQNIVEEIEEKKERIYCDDVNLEQSEDEE